MQQSLYPARALSVNAQLSQTHVLSDAQSFGKMVATNLKLFFRNV